MISAFSFNQQSSFRNNPTKDTNADQLSTDRHPFRLVIGAPISSEGLKTAELNDQVEHWINEQVDRISATPFSGEYVDADTSGKRF